MKSVSKDIMDHLNKHEGVYVNAQGVETELRMSGYICMVAQWPGLANDDYVIEIYMEVESIDDMVTLAGIYTFQQFLDLSPTRLQDLYHEGKAVICCAIDRETLYYELDFFKYNNTVWLVDDNDNFSVAPVAPETADDFLMYLKRHAHLDKVVY